MITSTHTSGTAETAVSADELARPLVTAFTPGERSADLAAFEVGYVTETGFERTDIRTSQICSL